MTELKITQADRDAAAAYYYSAGGFPKIANEIREGKKDGWFRVQAFALHRIAAEEGKAELVEALELADAALRGANMDIRFVEKKVSATLARVRGELT